MIYSYIRVSTNQQSTRVQTEEIQRYCDFNHLTIDETIEVEISSRKDSRERKIDELLAPADLFVQPAGEHPYSLN